MPMTVLHAGISNVGVLHAGITNVGVLHAGRVLNGSSRPPWEAAMVLYTNVYFIPTMLNRLIGGSCMALDWRLLHASLPLSHCLHLVAYGPS